MGFYDMNECTSTYVAKYYMANIYYKYEIAVLINNKEYCCGYCKNNLLQTENYWIAPVLI